MTTPKPGQCQFCNCTYDRPCEPPCSWANREQTICSTCDRTIGEIALVLKHWYEKAYKPRFSDRMNILTAALRESAQAKQ
jgi:hypothetical protein